MFAEVVRGSPADAFEEALSEARAEAGVAFDNELDAGGAARALTGRF